MGYKAVYPDEAITAHLAFVTRRRALRPTEEYRQPTAVAMNPATGVPSRSKNAPTCGPSGLAVISPTGSDSGTCTHISPLLLHEPERAPALPCRVAAAGG